MVSGSRKEAIRRKLVEHLRAERDAAAAAHKKTREGATHEEAKPESSSALIKSKASRASK